MPRKNHVIDLVTSWNGHEYVVSNLLSSRLQYLKGEVNCYTAPVSPCTFYRLIISAHRI